MALVTPMLEGGDIDYSKLEKLIDFHVKQGTHGLVIAGTTGESATMDIEEHCELLNRAREMINKRLPMIAGTGANSTSEAISLTKCAKRALADAALLVTPYYNKPTQEGLYLHHKAIAEAVDIDQLLYNVPGRTACDMLPETVQRLSQVKNIIGIKEATGDLQRLLQIQELVSDDFLLFSGDDATGCQFILQGGHGTISVTANVAPAQMAKMCEAAMGGKEQEALEIDGKISELHRVLFVEANPIPVKWAVSEMGLSENNFRLPMTPLAEKYHEQVRNVLKSTGIL